MEAYTSFAQVYDLFMDNVPYGEWCGKLTEMLRAQGIRDGLVLELGCGTGSLTELLAGQGYNMIGVDSSQEMLELAMEKKIRSGLDILYLLQDMRSFELYGTVAAMVSVCDSMNYILEYRDLVQVLKLANNYLDPGGIFIFDLNTPYKYQEILGDHTFAENREEGSFIWENFFDQERQINEFDLTFFIPAEDDKAREIRYRKVEETHFQRSYQLEEIEKAVRESGMELVGFQDVDSGGIVRPDSQRIYVTVRERGKEKTHDRLYH